MKKQILTFVIGVLVGAVLTAAVFIIVKPNSGRKMPNFNNSSEFGNFPNFSENGERPSRGTRGNRKSGDTKTEENKAEDNNTVKEDTNEKQ